MFSVVHEDGGVLVVNKSAGVAVHEIIEDVRKKHPYAELAHRLDKDTSGLLLIAKNPDAREYLKRLFQKRDIRKTYLALVVGHVAKRAGTISLPIARSTKDFRKRVASSRGRDGARSAETHFTVLQRFDEYTLLEVQPRTGRTHQIRSHLSSIGHPIACDALYGGKRFVCPGRLRRQFLHAAALELTTLNGERVRLEADAPEDLAEVLDSLHPVSRGS